MDASNIPNLNTLRTGRRRGGGLRGRADRSHQHGQDGDANQEAKDAIVQNTDQDAAQSRLSAVELGYLDDPFARAFVQGPTARRFPIINRGNFYLLNSFIVAELIGFSQEPTSAQRRLTILFSASFPPFLRPRSKSSPSVPVQIRATFASSKPIPTSSVH